jgi:hypothetical protein
MDVGFIFPSWPRYTPRMSLTTLWMRMWRRLWRQGRHADLCKPVPRHTRAPHLMFARRHAPRCVEVGPTPPSEPGYIFKSHTRWFRSHTSWFRSLAHKDEDESPGLVSGTHMGSVHALVDRKCTPSSSPRGYASFLRVVSGRDSNALRVLQSVRLGGEAARGLHHVQPPVMRFCLLRGRRALA